MWSQPFCLFAFHDDFAVFHVEGKTVFFAFGFIGGGGGAVGIAVPAHFAFATAAGRHKPGAVFVATVFFNVAQPRKAAGAEHRTVINKGRVDRFRRHRNLS